MEIAEPVTTDIIEGFRLSPQQSRLWLAQQSDPGRAYRVCSLIEIEGDLNPELLQRALESVVSQHEILRTSFQLLPGMTIPVQVIADEVATTLPSHDLTGISAAEQQETIDQLFNEAVAAVVDYSQPSLLSTQLLKLSDHRHFLLVSAPALCVDGPSVSRLLSQLAAAFEALQQNGETPVIETMQSADFAEWQNELLTSDAATTALDNWRRGAQAGPAPRLIFEKSEQQSTHAVPTVELKLSTETTTLIEAVSQSNKTSPTLFLLACWQTLLWRSTAAAAITVGLLFEGRKFAELDEAVGLLSSYLPLSTHFDERLSCADLLRDLAALENEASSLQEYFPAELRQGEPFAFEVQRQPAPVRAGALRFSLAHQEADTQAFKLKLVCTRGEGVFTAALHYDASLYSAGDIELLAERLTTLIESAAHRPESALAELEMIGSTERQLLLCDFNDTAKDFSTSQCVHEVFALQARRTPDRVAVIFEGEQLTFAALEKRANQLAQRLQGIGVGPDAAVGLCFERSLDLIVGLLGILKAGGAYVPLDPGLPKARLSLMLSEAGARFLVTRTELAEGLDDAVEYVVTFAGTDVHIKSEKENVAAARIEQTERRNLPSGNIEGAATEQNLAYIIFTSGSTGRPKGVAVEHCQLLNYVNAIWDELQLPEASTFATVSTIAADLGNTVLFPSLLKGGTLHLISEERATNPDALAEYCSLHPIDCLKIVPSHLAALLSAADPEKVLPRRKLVLGGEASSWKLIEKITALAPACEILNHYGPTEATVGATTERVYQSVPGLAEIVPLGRPLANAKVLMLDQHLRLTPLGAPGELHIGGAGVARGYVQRPEATAEKFISDPFADNPDARLYKTGDLARQLPDGRIEFLGRIDDQVKIHGYRIEPAEIEQALHSHPAVAAAIVIAREDQPGEKRLVAYVVPRAGAQIDQTELKTFLQQRLPDYMMPRGIVVLGSMPLTRNGKVDRQALPAPERAQTTAAETVAPRNEVEEKLATIWAGVLGVKQVGIHDNFFELGGDSILSIQIIARANQAGLKLSPRQLFEHQTIADLAGVAGTTVIHSAPQGPVMGTVPLTPVQARFFALELANPHHYNQAMLFEVDESLEVDVLERALNHLVMHHDALRLLFKQTEQGWTQEIVAPSNKGIAVEFISAPPSAEPLAAFQASLNLTNGPLFRVALITNQHGQPERLLIVIHHLLVDGVSWSVLLEDLQVLYGQLARDKQAELPARTTSFKSWGERLHAHADSETLLGEAPFWLSLSEAAATLLPVDFQHGPNISAAADSVSSSLNPRETLALLMEVPAAYRTQINEVLLTALAQTLSRWTGSPSVLIDLEGHGREELFPGVDLSRTVGWFTTIFPVRLDLQASLELSESLRLVKEQLRAIPNRGIGYGLLRYLSRKREITEALSRLPQAQVRFNYLGQTDRAMSHASLFRPCAGATGPSQSPAAERGYLLNIIGAVTGGELRLEWTYSKNIHNRETIARLAETYLNELRTLIANARSADTSSISPTDFPSARLSQAELNKVLSKLRR